MAVAKGLTTYWGKPSSRWEQREHPRKLWFNIVQMVLGISFQQWLRFWQKLITSWQCLGMAEGEGWESLGGGSWRTELDLMLLLSWWSWQWWCHQQWCRLPSTIHHHHLSCEGGRVGLGRGATWESGGRPSGAGRWREDDDDCQVDDAASITIFFVLPSNNHALHHINLTSSVKSSLHNQDNPFSLSPPTLCHKKRFKAAHTTRVSVKRSTECNDQLLTSSDLLPKYPSPRQILTCKGLKEGWGMTVIVNPHRARFPSPSAAWEEILLVCSFLVGSVSVGVSG